MRAIIQRVLEAKVEVDGNLISSINNGLLVFIGFHKQDTTKEIEYVVKKILGLRIFDKNNKMDLSIIDIIGEILLVSQFTLYGNLRKGNRPSYTDAMPSNKAEEFYNQFVDNFNKSYDKIKFGIFGADMKISLINSGPVTIFLDTDN